MNAIYPIALMIAAILSACTSSPVGSQRSDEEIRLLSRRSDLGSIPNQQGQTPTAVVNPTMPSLTTDTLALLKVINDRYNSAFAACLTESQNYQNKISKTGHYYLALIGAGVISGSIVVPALAARTVAAKSTVAAWGGVSGAANAMQYAENQLGLGPAQMAAASTVMTTKMTKALHDYSVAVTGNDTSKASAAVDDLVVACQFPSVAEIQAAIPPSVPDPPKLVEFQAKGDGTSGLLSITPPDANGGLPINSYQVLVKETGVEVGELNFQDPKKVTVMLNRLTVGQSYTALVRAKNGLGLGNQTVITFPAVKP